MAPYAAFPRTFLSVLLFLSSPALAQETCPWCERIEDWLVANADACGYHGARLPSICENDPDCVEWNARCSDKREELARCLASCTPEDAEAAARAREALELASEYEAFLGMGFDARAEDPAWCERQRARLTAHDAKRFIRGRIGTLQADASQRIVVHRCDGKTTPGSEDLEIYPGDCVETDGGRGASLLMTTGLDSRWFADQQYLKLGNRPGRICFPGVLPREADQPDGSFGSLVSGAIRSFFLGPEVRRSVVLGPGRMARFRGTDAIITRDANSGALEILVREGRVDLFDREREEPLRIVAGEGLRLEGDGAGTVAALAADDWAAALEAHGLEIAGVDRGAPGELPRAACAAAIGRWRWWNGVEVRVEENGRWSAADGNSGPWRCEIGRAGIFAVVAGEDGRWADSLQSTDDGSALHGRNRMGGVVGAQRLDP